MSRIPFGSQDVILAVKDLVSTALGDVMVYTEAVPASGASPSPVFPHVQIQQLNVNREFNPSLQMNRDKLILSYSFALIYRHASSVATITNLNAILNDVANRFLIGASNIQLMNSRARLYNVSADTSFDMMRFYFYVDVWLRDSHRWEREDASLMDRLRIEWDEPDRNANTVLRQGWEVYNDVPT